MSYQALNAVWDHSATTQNERVMMLAIADQANDRGYVYAFQEDLATRCRVDPETARRLLRNLRAKGELLACPTYKRNRQRQSVYYINIGPFAGKVNWDDAPAPRGAVLKPPSEQEEEDTTPAGPDQAGQNCPPSKNGQNCPEKTGDAGQERPAMPGRTDPPPRADLPGHAGQERPGDSKPFIKPFTTPTTLEEAMVVIGQAGMGQDWLDWIEHCGLTKPLSQKKHAVKWATWIASGLTSQLRIDVENIIEGGDAYEFPTGALTGRMVKLQSPTVPFSEQASQTYLQETGQKHFPPGTVLLHPSGVHLTVIQQEFENVYLDGDEEIPEAHVHQVSKWTVLQPGGPK